MFAEGGREGGKRKPVFLVQWTSLKSGASWVLNKKGNVNMKTLNKRQLSRWQQRAPREKMNCLQ